ncbi:C-terminal binding protein [Sediminispirochaeta smaragdinae]|uniref:D-isomer specific 2-hydroxyacid dehydrogenase NAD-binding protein n=1 Tax=Sediminispirochaeta smaragdinae (strain DSM 11293 / JCM 15392 / SEBR 4228) TaxID=573413 RepID=E1RCH8_SEDSS|nr:C-terminal binding protein [Sediminispirochaeta smaragdinae]ADK80058.1 D-isomer specific 2-hydroxyacid dehydrogenase NAD-binding protein [Sediminispirochaeta smaragdinae DSM 11293]
MSFLVAQVDYDYPDTRIEREIIEAAGGELKSAHLRDEQELIDFAADADAVIVQYAPITRNVLEHLPSCKIVSRYGIGIDNVDTIAAQELGIYVAHNPEYCIDEVSDHALAMIMTLQRQIASGTDLVKQGIWDFTKLTPIKASPQTTIGIIGFGHIGRRIAQKLQAIGFSCIAHDPYVAQETFDSHGVRRVALPYLMQHADCITVHCSLTDETKNLVDAAMIGLMKPEAYIVNTSRGPVIDVDALSLALRQGKVRGAALDVLPEEPPKSFEEIAHLPSLLLTPHIAFYSETAIVELRSSIARQVVQVMQNEPPQYNAY